MKTCLFIPAFFLSVLAVIYLGAPSGLSAQEPQISTAPMNPAFEAYLLKSKGVGVSTILTFTLDDTTGYYLLATTQTEQKKGFAGILFQYILEQYAQRSNNPVILHATQAGEALYTKLGFQPVNQFYLYRQLKAEI